MSPFAFWWSRRFEISPPLGWMLRAQYPQRWMRIHSLPGSRRYAASPADRALILRRHNILARAVLGGGAPCWIVAARYRNSNRRRRKERVVGLELRLPWAFSMFEEPEFGEESELLDIYCARVTWRSESFDTLLTNIAQDRERVLFASERSGRIFAPYDGGADVIALSTAERDRFKRRFRAWLSQRADGK